MPAVKLNAPGLLLFSSLLFLPVQAECLGQATQEAKKKTDIRKRIDRLERGLEAIEFLLKHDLEGQYTRIESLRKRLKSLGQRITSTEAEMRRIESEASARIERMRKGEVVPTPSFQREVDAVRKQAQREVRAQDALRRFYVTEKRKLRIILSARQQEWKEAAAQYPERAKKIQDRLSRAGSKAKAPKESPPKKPKDTKK